MILQADAPLQAYNTFGIAAKAAVLAHVTSVDDVHELLARDDFGRTPKLVLGGGSNLVFTRDVDAVVMKMEIGGLAVVDETPDDWVVQAGSGVDWHELVRWTVTQGYPGLENMALIPGSVGASPVQNIGAYGVELQNRFHSLDAVDLRSGQGFTLQPDQCGFGYRDSVFKHVPSASGGMGLKGAAVITQVRFALPKRWRSETAYQDLQRKVDETGITQPSAQQVFDWVVDIRTAKLPDPRDVGNAGGFFKNPTVTAEQCDDIIGRDPRVVHYPLGDGRIKLAAGWLIDACGWKGKSIGRAGVYEKQALVLVNRGTREEPVTGGEVMTLARAIQTSVYERFGILLEPEPEVI
jgi:UDP-N-acetylmuramate dehydrogenase